MPAPSSAHGWRTPLQGMVELARAWRLSRACAHAGAETLWDTPGAANWPRWLATLAASASDAIDAGCHHPIDPAPQAALLASEHWASPQEQFEAAAATLLVTCLQTLALFGTTGQARAGLTP